MRMPYITCSLQMKEDQSNLAIYNFNQVEPGKPKFQQEIPEEGEWMI